MSQRGGIERVWRRRSAAVILLTVGMETRVEEHGDRRRRWRVLALIVLVWSSHAMADSREDYLVSLLRTSDAFRVRAQAALSLSQLPSTPRLVGALESAVRDDHPAVRVAAIASLQRLEAKQSLPIVERATRDRDKAVRRAAAEALEVLRAAGRRPRGPGPTEYLVAIGMPGAKSERVSRKMLFDVRGFLSAQLQEVQGVELAPDELTPAEAQREIEDRNLHGVYLESSIVSLEPKAGGVRAAVAVIVTTYPGREMRGVLRGAATASGAYGEETASQAIEGALTGALRRLPTVLETAKARGRL